MTPVASQAPAGTTASALSIARSASWSAAPSEVSARNFGQPMPSAPATGGATSETPGTKRPMMKKAGPQRPKPSALRATQVSGESEKRQRRPITVAPKRRPAANQTALPMTLPATTASTSETKATTSGLAAPATSTVGVSGIGTASSCSSALMKTITTPKRSKSSCRFVAAVLLFRGQLGVDLVEQGLHAEGDVVDHAVQEEGRRRAHAARPAAFDILAHPLQVHGVAHVGVVARHVELQLLAVVTQLRRLQMRLVGKKQVVHRPELALPGRGFRGERGVQRMRMHFLEREVAPHETHAAGVAPEQDLH